MNLSHQTVQYSSLMNISLRGVTAMIISGSPKGDDIVAKHLKYY